MTMKYLDSTPSYSTISTEGDKKYLDAEANWTLPEFCQLLGHYGPSNIYSTNNHCVINLCVARSDYPDSTFSRSSSGTYYLYCDKISDTVEAHTGYLWLAKTVNSNYINILNTNSIVFVRESTTKGRPTTTNIGSYSTGISNSDGESHSLSAVFNITGRDVTWPGSNLVASLSMSSGTTFFSPPTTIESWIYKVKLPVLPLDFDQYRITGYN